MPSPIRKNASPTTRTREFFSPLETIVCFYVSGTELGGYEICQKMNQDGVKDFFHYTEAAVYRALQRISEAGYLKERKEMNGRRSTILYKITVKGSKRLEISILNLIRNYLNDPDARIGFAMLRDMPIAKSIEAVRQLYADLKIYYSQVKHELEHYEGGKTVARWSLLGHEERRLEADLNWFGDMLDGFEKDLANGRESGFGNMPTRGWMNI